MTANEAKHRTKLRELENRLTMLIVCEKSYGENSEQAKKARRKYEKCNQERWWTL